MSDTPELTDYSRGFIEGRKAALAEREAEVERLRVAAAGVLPMLPGHDDCAWEPGTGFECEVARLRAALAKTPEAEP